jgi:hypothetical protein
MPRKKITLELRGLLTPRERMWSAMLECSRAKGSTFTRSMIEDRAYPLHYSTIEDYLEGLELAGYVARAKKQVRSGTGFKATEWRLVKRQADAPRVDKQGRDTSGQGAGVEAMWRMAKVLRTFTSEHLARTASQGGVLVQPHTAKTYCRALTRSGHFAVHKAGHRGNGGYPDTYHLTNDTGPQPPAITREKCVFDRNTGTLVPMRTPQEVCDAIG